MTKKYTSIISSTHSLSFPDIIEDQIRCAFENELLNMGGEHQPVAAGVHKKSPVQNGAAAVACLLIFIVFESTVRVHYYHHIGKKKAHSDKLWDLIVKLKSSIIDTVAIKSYYEELNLIRDIIAHAYIFDGSLEWGESHRLVAINETVVSGKYKSKIGKSRTTQTLKLHQAPNQISFVDAAKFYLAFEVLLEALDLRVPYELWPMNDEHLKPNEWLKAAMNKVNMGDDETWRSLWDMKRKHEYESFIGRLGQIDAIQE